MPDCTCGHGYDVDLVMHFSSCPCSPFYRSEPSGCVACGRGQAGDVHTCKIDHQLTHHECDCQSPRHQVGCWYNVGMERDQAIVARDAAHEQLGELQEELTEFKQAYARLTEKLAAANDDDFYFKVHGKGFRDGYEQAKADGFEAGYLKAEDELESLYEERSELIAERAALREHLHSWQQTADEARFARAKVTDERNDLNDALHELAVAAIAASDDREGDWRSNADWQLAEAVEKYRKYNGSKRDTA